MITARSQQLIKLYGHYKNNILLWSGGIWDQPAPYVESMEIIDRVVNEHANDKR